MNKFKGKEVLVYGQGISGYSACKLLEKVGANVSVYDDNISQNNFDPLSKKFDYVVLSPGVNITHNDLLLKLKENSKIISELELGMHFMKGKVIAITGTNGKTTTVSMLAKVLQTAKKKVFLCGNIGVPITSICLDTTRNSYSVVEVSSFQLEGSQNFHPQIASILNITEDHLDRHGSIMNYQNIKTSIFKKFSRKDIAVLNYDDEYLKTINTMGRNYFFSKKYITNGAYLSKGRIFFEKRFIMDSSGIRLIGSKNIENVLAVVTIASLLKIKEDIIREGIKSFYPLKNRLEPLGFIDGIRFINDSKATNVDGTLAALEAIDEPVLLLLGGRNKGARFYAIFKKKDQIKYAYIYGECQEELTMAALREGFEDFKVFDYMKDAVIEAKKDAIDGDIILLSPAVASFDEFKDYVERGEKFKEIFAELKNEEKKN